MKILYAQTPRDAFEALRGIRTVDDYIQLKKLQKNWKIRADTVIAGANSIYYDIVQMSVNYSNVGDTLIGELCPYCGIDAQKILESYDLPIYTCKYIALDIGELGAEKADSLQKVIVKKFKNCESFELLEHALTEKRAIENFYNVKL